jgi:hypothetical protein
MVVEGDLRAPALAARRFAKLAKAVAIEACLARAPSSNRRRCHQKKDMRISVHSQLLTDHVECLLPTDTDTSATTTTASMVYAIQYTKKTDGKVENGNETFSIIAAFL